MAGGIVMAIIVTIAVLYPLSAGPAMALGSRGMMSGKMWWQLYAPLYRIDDHVSPGYRPFGNYISLWQPLARPNFDDSTK